MSQEQIEQDLLSRAGRLNGPLASLEEIAIYQAIMALEGLDRSGQDRPQISRVDRSYGQFYYRVQLFTGAREDPDFKKMWVHDEFGDATELFVVSKYSDLDEEVEKAIQTAVRSFNKYDWPAEDSSMSVDPSQGGNRLNKDEVESGDVSHERGEAPSEAAGETESIKTEAARRKISDELSENLGSAEPIERNSQEEGSFQLTLAFRSSKEEETVKSLLENEP